MNAFQGATSTDLTLTLTPGWLTLTLTLIGPNPNPNPGMAGRPRGQATASRCTSSRMMRTLTLFLFFTFSASPHRNRLAGGSPGPDAAGPAAERPCWPDLLTPRGCGLTYGLGRFGAAGSVSMTASGICRTNACLSVGLEIPVLAPTMVTPSLPHTAHGRTHTPHAVAAGFVLHADQARYPRAA